MKSLRARVLLLLAAFGLIISMVLSFVLYRSAGDYYTDLQYERSSDFAERLLAMHPDMWGEYERNPSGFGDILRQYTLYAPRVGLYLLDREGQVLASSGESRLFWSSWKVDLSPVRGSLAGDPARPVFGDDPDVIDGQCLVAARPIIVHGRERGWLYVVARYADSDTAPAHLLGTYAIKSAIKFGLLSLTIGVVLTMAIIAMMTRPLGALTQVAEKIKESGFSGSFDVATDAIPHCSRHDEIGRLGRAFQEMLDRLRTEMQRVTAADAKRREMVASVSHDLRTPLTAITAQLETIKLKGDTLPPEQQAQLIDRAILNAQHLKRLTDSLAEVARLDNPDFRAQTEPMAPGELADDVVQRFASRAENQGVTLDIDYPDGMPLMALDAGLFDRALSNLIDNALRVTPRGGQVQVRVAHAADGLRIEVSDTGPGVAIDEQERVFDLFYQASTHREHRGSSGLGLAIVRRVAELHGGKVGLTSQPGKGSTFFMALPA